jgi:toxin ParE1/3/4
VRIEWLLSAALDSDEIADYISIDNAMAARIVVDRIDMAVARLAIFPYSGRTSRIVGTRELVVRKTSYVVIYSVDGDVVWISNIIHGAQQWPPEAIVPSHSG